MFRMEYCLYVDSYKHGEDAKLWAYFKQVYTEFILKKYIVYKTNIFLLFWVMELLNQKYMR
jgi:hypothetical protein